MNFNLILNAPNRGLTLYSVLIKYYIQHFMQAKWKPKILDSSSLDAARCCIEFEKPSMLLGNLQTQMLKIFEGWKTRFFLLAFI